jgi:hypothetical protein
LCKVYDGHGEKPWVWKKRIGYPNRNNLILFTLEILYLYLLTKMSAQAKAQVNKQPEVQPTVRVKIQGKSSTRCTCQSSG